MIRNYNFSTYDPDNFSSYSLFKPDSILKVYRIVSVLFLYLFLDVLTPFNTSILSAQTTPTSFISGKFDPAIHPDFVEIIKPHAEKVGMYLQKDAYQAFIEMYKEAKKSGVNLKIISATRTFEDQKRIWENKWNGKVTLSNGKKADQAYPNPKERAQKILEYSSMPGTSRHHWGTDIDLNALNNTWFESGEGAKLYQWMLINASKFGFCRPYTSKDSVRPHGYNEEKWHWSYMPIAGKITSEIKLNFSESDIADFDGCEQAIPLQIVDHYMLGINQSCF